MASGIVIILAGLYIIGHAIYGGWGDALVEAVIK